MREPIRSPGKDNVSIPPAPIGVEDELGAGIARPGLGVYHEISWHVNGPQVMRVPFWQIPYRDEFEDRRRAVEELT